jgi:hypothetical protein
MRSAGGNRLELSEDWLESISDAGPDCRKNISAEKEKSYGNQHGWQRPKTWDPALDGVLAAPENHTVLYEDDLIRVIAVSIAPGTIEKPHHHHRFPSIFVIDRMVKLRDFNGVTKEEIPLPIPDHREIPAAAAPLCRECRHEVVPRDQGQIQAWLPGRDVTVAAR